MAGRTLKLKTKTKTSVKKSNRKKQQSKLKVFFNILKQRRAILFAVFFAIIGVTILYLVNAQNTPNTYNEVAFLYSEGHGHEESQFDLKPVDYPLVLYKDGLLVCSAHGHGSEESSPTQAQLNKEQMNEFLSAVRTNGLDSLEEKHYESAGGPADPIALYTTVFADFGRSQKYVTYSSGDRPSGLSSITSFTHNYCDNKAVEAYDADTYTVDSVIIDNQTNSRVTGLAKAREVIGAKLSRNDRLAQAIRSIDNANKKQAQSVNRQTASEIKKALKGKSEGVMTIEGAEVLVRLTPLLRPYELKGQSNVSIENESDKVYAATAKKVEFVWFYASNQSLQSGYTTKLNGTSQKVRSWYRSQVGEDVLHAKNYTKKGAKTVAQYETCPSGKNCAGDKLLAAFYNVQAELGTLTDAQVVVMFQGSETTCKGWGSVAGSTANNSVTAAKSGTGIVNVTGCTWDDGREKIAGHEFGHGLGSAHSCYNYNIMANSSCATTGNGLPHSILHSTQKSSWANYSQFFGGVRTYLNGNEHMYQGHTTYSPQKKYRLVMQGDGNLVIYSSNNSAVWSARTGGNSGAFSIFQTDGNLVLRKPSGKYCHAASNGKGGYRLNMQDDGNLVIYKSDLKTAVWSRYNGWYCN